MNTVHVDTSKKYDVIIGQVLLDTAGEQISKLIKPSKALIVTDDNVASLYLGRLETSLKASGFEPVSFVIPNGEASKNAENLIKILNFAAENRLTRSDVVVALGGGVVGDLAGFAAAVYLRGVKLIQIPTTLLSAVDSSVGGKTAIDLDAGKNLAGAFYQPSLVLCDYTTLDTLTDEFLTDGMGEVIKYALLGNTELLDHLTQRGRDLDYDYVITECVKMKRDVVCADEFDTGRRMTLNLGHTVGHAIEAANSYTLSHGRCVAAGMAIITLAAVNDGICDIEVYNRIVEVLEKFGLPTSTNLDFDTLFDIMTADKKIMNGGITLTIPTRLGECIMKKMSLDEFKNFIKAGF